MLPRAGDEVRLRPRGDGPPKRDPAITAMLVEQFAHPDPAWWELLRRISVPALLLAGGPESHVPQDRIGEAAALVPHGQLVEIPAGHFIHSNRPAEFVAAVDAFALNS